MCPVPVYAKNIDSLQYKLENAVEDSVRCATASLIFQHYKNQNNLDSIRQYAEKTLQCCPLETKEGMDNTVLMIFDLFKADQAQFVDSLIQSNVPYLTDDVDKLLYYTKVSERAYLTGHDTQFNYYLDKAKSQLNTSQENLSKAYYYNLFGYYNMNKGNEMTALKSYEVSLSFTDTLNEKYFRYSTDLGVAYNKIGEHEKAIDLFTRNIEVATRRNYDGIRIFSYYGLISSYGLMKNYEKCITLCHEALSLEKKKSLSESGYLYYSLGSSHLLSSEKDSAIYYFNKGLEFSKERADTKGIQDNYIGIADYYSAVKDYDKAEQYYLEAMDVSTYIPNVEINQSLADIYFKKNDFENASLYLNRYIESINKSKVDKQSDLQLAAQLIEDADKYKKTTSREINQRKKEQERLYKILIAAAALMFFIMILLYFIQKNRKKLAGLNQVISDQNKVLKTAINKQNESIEYLENFAAVAAHDLKAPIRTASSFATLLSRKSKDKFTEKELDWLNFVSTGISQLSTMIDDLLSLSKLGTNLPDEAPVDINRIIKVVESHLSKKIEESSTQIIVTETLPTVLGHESLLVQLFQNLIKNSIAHNKTNNTPSIEIEYEVKNPDSYLIRVSDNSGGIPDHILPTLFDLFSSSDKNSGNGIGLAICKKIITHYGGEIWVTTNENIGSTFHFTLPKYREHLA